MLDKLVYHLRRLFLTPFKVGLISYYYLDDSSQNNGVAIHTYYLSRELAKLGCEVHVFTKGDKNTVKDYYVEKGMIVIHKINTKIDCPIRDNFIKKRFSYFMFDNAVITEVTKENAKEKFNIIHTHGWLTAGAFISKSLNDIKWIHTFHAIEKNRLRFMSSEEKKYFMVAKWVESTINHADALIAVSKILETEVFKNYKIKKEKVYYIPNGVDLSLFNPEGSSPNDKKITYVGRFSLEKGIDLIPKIAQGVLERNKDAKFVVCASSVNLPNSLQKITKKFDELTIKYQNRFIWINKLLGREELAKLYKESLICIQPSRYEAFGLCVLEGMACGKAVICSNVGGLPEVVGNAGIIMPFNVDLFVKQCLLLLENYRLRERYARRAAERAKLFNWEKIGQETLNLYKKVSLKNK